jgi:hypothetical protein
MPLASDVQAAIAEAQSIADAAAKAVETYLPGEAIPAAAIAGVVDLTSLLAQKAVATFSAASGTPITAESVMALLPNPAPLTPPTA